MLRPVPAAQLVGKARADGAYRDPSGGTVWKLAPPLTVARAEIDEALAIVDQVLREPA